MSSSNDCPDAGARPPQQLHELGKDFQADCLGPRLHNWTAPSRLAVEAAAAMDEERYQLLGDSSLYTKSGKKKRPLKGELEQMLGAPTEVTYKAGGGASYILEAGAWMAFWGV